MPWVGGVDGCRGGWFVVLVEYQRSRPWNIIHQKCSSFQDVLHLHPRPTIVGVDIPIGLLVRPKPGGRECDKSARHILGRGRASSVFSPPSRRALVSTRYAQVRHDGLSKQAFHISPKIREVDRLMTPPLQKRIYEVHPELSFTALAGHPMRNPKKTFSGQKERIRLLIPWFPRIQKVIRMPRYPGVYPDDILDAYAASWTAIRILTKQANCLPKDPPVDAKGLRMEIRY
jgi:predicted RNase H-like nuclease